MTRSLLARGDLLYGVTTGVGSLGTGDLTVLAEIGAALAALS